MNLPCGTKTDSSEQAGLTDAAHGQSGCELLRLGDAQVRKSAAGLLARRLRAQCDKQAAFSIATPGFEMCAVLDRIETDKAFAFTMPYHGGQAAVAFFDRAAPASIRGFAQRLAALVGELNRRSHAADFPVEQVVAKSEQTYLAISPAFRPHREVLARHLEDVRRARGTPLAQGLCHGDLTFSNMIFLEQGRRIILIDCLDAYLEAPILDLAKIRQETVLFWSSLTARTPHDRARFRLAMQLIDAVLRRDADVLFHPAHLLLFEFQNLLRVLRYTTDPLVAGAIMARLNILSRVRS